LAASGSGFLLAKSGRPGALGDDQIEILERLRQAAQ
jgi:hypothetical protein